MKSSAPSWDVVIGGGGLCHKKEALFLYYRQYFSPEAKSWNKNRHDFNPWEQHRIPHKRNPSLAGSGQVGWESEEGGGCPLPGAAGREWEGKLSGEELSQNPEDRNLWAPPTFLAASSQRSLGCALGWSRPGGRASRLTCCTSVHPGHTLRSVSSSPRSSPVLWADRDHCPSVPPYSGPSSFPIFYPKSLGEEKLLLFLNIHMCSAMLMPLAFPTRSTPEKEGMLATIQL